MNLSIDILFPLMVDKLMDKSDKDVYKRQESVMPTIVLSHNPKGRELLGGYHWNLMLSGHTHGEMCIRDRRNSVRMGMMIKVFSRKGNTGSAADEQRRSICKV